MPEPIIQLTPEQKKKLQAKLSGVPERELNRMAQSQLENIEYILEELPSSQELNKKEFRFIRNNSYDKNDISPIINAMLKSDIPLTRRFFELWGTSKLQKIFELTPEQRSAVSTIFTALSKLKPPALDNKTFEYVVSQVNNETFKKKAGDVAAVFAKMNEVGLSTIGHRQPVMNMNGGPLETLKVILENLPPGTKLSKDEFKALRSNVPEGMDLEQAQAFGQIIGKMKKSGIDIPLTHTIGKPNLENLLNVKSHLEQVNQIIDSLPDNDLDEKTFDHIIKQAAKGDLKEDKTKALVNVFEAMEGKVEITGHRQPLMNMKEEELKDLTTVLGELSETKLSKDEFKALRDMVPSLNKNIRVPATEAAAAAEKRLKKMGAIIKIMKENKNSIPLVKSNLKKFQELDSPNLKQVSQLLGGLSGNALDKKTFDYIVKEAAKNDKLLEKSDDLVKVFNAMKNKVDITGHRQPLMKMDKGPLTILATILKQLPKETELSKDEFKALRSNVPEGMDLEQAQAFGQIIGKMAGSDIPLTHTIGKQNLQNLLNVPPKNLKNVHKLLDQLADNNALDEKTFDYIVKEAAKDKSDQLDNTDALVDVFNAMKYKVEITGHRQPLMKMKPGQLNNLATILNKLSGKKLSKDEFKALRSNLPEEIDDDQAEAFNQIIGKMANSKIPLTQTFGRANMKNLLKIDPDKLEKVAALLESLPKDALDEKTFNYIIKEAALDKTDALVKVFNAMQDKGIEITGHRQPLMKMDKEHLENLAVILEQLSDTTLTKDEFKALRDSVPDVTAGLDPDDAAVYLNESEKRAKSLGAIINIMKDKKNNISLTPTIGRQNLKNLLKVPPGKLETVHEMIEQLAKKNHLDEKTFAYIVNHAKDFDDKKLTALGKVFEAMNNSEVAITGHRQPLMDMSETHINNIASFLEGDGVAKNKIEKLSGNDFKALRQNPSILENDDRKSMLKLMIKNKIPLTQRIGKDRIGKLDKLISSQRSAVLKIMETLSSKNALDERTFDYLVDNANKLDNTNYVKRIVSIFEKMDDQGIPIKGCRQPLMDLSLDQLVKVSKAIDRLGTLGIGKNEIKSLANIIKSVSSNDKQIEEKVQKIEEKKGVVR